MFKQRRKRQGLTLLELALVLIILIAVAGLIVPQFASTIEESRREATIVNMANLRNVLVGTPNHPGYLQDMKGVAVGPNATGIPDLLQDLFVQPVSAANFDPLTKFGWRGPYLANQTGLFDFSRLDSSFLPYGSAGAPAVLDGWGNPIVLQWPATADTIDVRAKYVRLVSAGPATKPSAAGKLSLIDTLADVLLPQNLTPDKRGNDIVLFLSVPDPYASDLFAKGSA